MMNQVIFLPLDVSKRSRSVWHVSDNDILITKLIAWHTNDDIVN
jgi:hypothetical protein